MSPRLERWRAAAESFDHGGRRYAYWSAGDPDRPTLFLFHGFPTASFDWKRIWPFLSALFSLLAFDFLGFGFSEKPRKTGFTIAMQADAAQALLRRMSRSTFHIIAHDYGVTVAQELMARDGERLDPQIRSVCFLNGGIFPEAHKARPLQKLLASPIGPFLTKRMTQERFSQEFAAIFGADTQPEPEELQDFWSLIAHDDGFALIPKLLHYMRERRTHRDRWVTPLMRVHPPTRLINGVSDPISGEHMADMFEWTVPRADVVRLSCGHYPQWEAPRSTLQAIMQFHDRISSS